MPEPYIPHTRTQWDPAASQIVRADHKPRKPVEGIPPIVAMDSRKGRMISTGDDTPTLITLVVALIGLLIFMAGNFS